MEDGDALMARIGELWLKSEPVKKQFMKTLTRNIKAALDLEVIDYRIEEYRGRILIFGDTSKTAHVVSKIFGIVDLSVCKTTGNSMDEIADAAVLLAKKNLKPNMKFAVRAKRQFVKGYSSHELAAYIADKIWDSVCEFTVDLNNPEYEIFAEAREYGGIVYDNRIQGQGGLPLGTAGRAAVLLSGGIDSPAAAWLMMKRGVSVTGVFMDAGKFSGPASKELALDNARILSKWCKGRAIPVWVVNNEKFLSEVSEKMDTHYMCMYCKRFMIRAAQAIADKNRLEAIVTGDNIGQVASQTLQNMGVISQVSKLPILRPLLTYDKEETVTLARRIGTFHDSPGNTECFAVPKKPATRSSIDFIASQEALIDIDGLITAAADSAELWIAKNGEIFKKDFEDKV